MPTPRLPSLLAIGFAAAALLACGGGEDDGGAPAGSTSTGPAAGAPAPAAADATELYFTAGEQLHKVERKLPGSGTRRMEAAVEAIVEGPTDREEQARAEPRSVIPASTEVRRVELDDGTATVEVSGDFTGGIPANPAARSPREVSELNARLAQVTYTLTSFSEVDEAKVVSGGIAVEPAREREDFAEPEGKPRQPAPPRGSAVSGIRQVQERLADLHYLPRGAIDGLNGYRTQQAVMAFQSWEGLERDGVAGPITKAALAEAKRPRPKGSGPSRRLEVYRSKGVLLLVKDGRTKRAIHVSSGAPGYTTPDGTFQVFRKELRSWSVPYSVWLPYASYFNNGIAFHEWASVPPFPASHGCVRVPSPEAKLVYRFAKLGRTVVVR